MGQPGGQPNSARFAAALKIKRCRLFWSAPSRMKSSVARFSRGMPSATAAAALGLRFALPFHGQQGGLPVGGGLRIGHGHDRQAEGVR